MALQGRVALVTGGGRGIGRAVARRLAAEGARVIVSGRRVAELEATAAEIRGIALPLDVADRQALAPFLDALAREAGPVDILVNNAGIAESSPFDRTDDARWDRILEVNATAPFRLCRALVPGMIARGWGRVVMMASNAGVSGYAYTAAYCASKHAMVGLMRAMAAEVAKTGVTVNAVCPGWVATDMVDQTVARIADKTGRSADQARGALAAMTPQGRILEAEEVAHVVAMLCHEEARGLHGQAVVIDGGAVMK